MEIFAFLLAIGALAYLSKVGLIMYWAFSMDFDFHRPWPDELPYTEQVDQKRESLSPETQPEVALKEPASLLAT